MALKPIDQRQGGIDARDRVWEHIRRIGTETTFTCIELAGDSRAHPITVRDYLSALVASGRVVCERPSTGRGKAALYRLVCDTGRETPRVRDDGSPVVQGRVAENMWWAMRKMGPFSVTDLVAHAGTEEVPVDAGYAVRYVASLAVAGYLLRCDDGRYLLNAAMNTGPKPPKIQRIKTIYDQNLRRVVWPSAQGAKR